MLIIKLKTAGSHNYCREALVVYNGADICLVSYGTEICAIRDGELTMKCPEAELTTADKRHLKTFCERFKHRLS